MTTTELIKILKDNELGGISHKPREISLTINGKCMTNPQITLSSTGDGVCGPEIDLDVDGEVLDQVPKKGHWIMHLDDLFPADSTMECSVCGEHQPLIIDDNYCPSCGSYNGGGV